MGGILVSVSGFMMVCLLGVDNGWFGKEIMRLARRDGIMWFRIIWLGLVGV